jgi:RNA polymerase sigma-70 factor (ECF subfamily)
MSIATQACSSDTIQDTPAQTADPGVEAFSRYLAGGGEAAFQDLLKTYLPSVRHICRRILGYSPLVDDAVQETFIKAARYAHTVVGDPGAWLRACALNNALSILRSEKARRRRERVYASEMPEVSFVAEETPWEQALVLNCLTKINDQDRQVLIEHYLMGRSQTDIARDFGISQVAIHKRIHRALVALRVSIVASGAADGLRQLATVHSPESNACVIPDPVYWLLSAVATSRRERITAVLLRPIEAVVQALLLEDSSHRYHASCVRRSLQRRILNTTFLVVSDLCEYLHWRIWHSRQTVHV